MAGDSIQPLRINKMPSPSSPSKLPRPTSEKSSSDDSAREGSPVRSPRAIWSKDAMARGRFIAEGTPEREVVQLKKSSIENLKKQSRVANNPLFANQSRVVPQAPPPRNKPMAKLDGMRKENSPVRDTAPKKTHDNTVVPPQSPSKTSSPQKSSLTAKGRYANQGLALDMEGLSVAEEEAREASPPQQLRPRKSVTFQSAPETHEYEPTTPEPSFVTQDSRESSYESEDADEDSLERAHSAEYDDDSFDASLEDINKTPVVLPGEWRHTSPGTARTDLIDDDDDVFEGGSPPPNANPGKLQRPSVGSRSESMNSEGSNRPLPPIPSMNHLLRGRTSSGSLNAAAELASSQRPQPSPPRPATVSKADILRMKSGMTNEERIDLMVRQDNIAEENRRNSIIPKASFENRSVISDQLGDLPEFDYAPQISRESIMKKVKADLDHDHLPGEEEEEEPDSMYSIEGVDYSDLARRDPDDPIPSRETSTQFNDVDFPIKEEEHSVLDFDMIPQLSYDPAAYGEPFSDMPRRSSVVHYSDDEDEEDEKMVSAKPSLEPSPMPEDGPATEPGKQELNKKASLPFLANFLGRSDLDFGLTDFTALTRDASVIPERKATIKTNGRLKARPSGTPSDLEAVIAAQREAMANEEMPDFPLQYRRGSPDEESLWSHPSTADSGESKNDSAVGSGQEYKIDLGLSSSEASLGASYSLAQEMARVIDAQQKGYLMRQNTKVVVARRDISGPSATTTEDEGAPTAAKRPVVGSRKASNGEKFIQTEPWNGKMRRKSQRQASTRIQSGPAPPLPGQESALGTLEENSILSEEDEDVERGRLFVKVAGVKDLDMPFPRGERLAFQLTLDNGLHCVTTGSLDLHKDSVIGQEFELVVQQDLDFQLTLTTNLPPPPKADNAGFFSRGHKPKSPSKSMFSRLLSSPKKRAEQERRAQAEAEEDERRRAEEEERARHAAQAPAWNKMRELVDSTTGSFARAYISLKYHEEQCYGRMLTTNMPLYNEWAMEKDMNVVSSVRSKRSNGYGVGMRGDGVVRRPPYQIGNLEVHLLYIPRGKNFADSDMPKSMSAAMRDMAEAERVSGVKHEGFLSQQGGDCPYWRRRFFRLASTKLTAFHEHTMQPRATINLSKASKLIDDKTSLVADPEANKVGGSKRRKSAFAEEDDGYQFVEEGFRLRFTNGETIDFYANTAAEKDEWMAALGRAIGKTATAGKTAKWTETVLSHEAKLAARRSRMPAAGPEINICPATSSVPSLTSPPGMHASWTKSAPTSPVKSGTGSVVRKEVPRPMSMAASVASGPVVPPKDDEEERRMHVPPESRWLAELDSRPVTPPMGKRTDGKTRKAVKSMIF